MKELVGKGKPFYSALDRALETLPEKASPEQIVNHLIKMGVKPQEIIDRRMDKEVGAPLIPRERTVKLKKPDDKGRTEIVEPYFETTRVSGAKAIPRKVVSELAQKNPMVAPVEKVLGKMSDSEFLQRANDIAEQNFGVPYGQLDHEKQSSIEGYIDEDTSYHRAYTLPGGENYREMLIKAPKGGEEFPGVSNHFGGEPGILASMRLKDRIGPNGEKLLHLEELQSDWHQQGREVGYKRPNTGGLPELKEGWKYEDFNGKIGIRDPRGILAVAVEKPEDAIRYIRENGWAKPNSGVPDAPFKKNWEEMALKRLIHHAAEKGYHGIVVTPGHEQADRYSLAKHINELHLSGTNLVAYDHNGNEVIKKTGVTSQELPSLVGKETAEKLMAQQPQGTLRSLTGQNLEVGGEGMKGFYDKKVPNILNSIGKKYGVKTQLHAHPIKTEREQMVPDNAGLGMIRSGKPEYAHAHHFPITEEMRKDVLTNGLPLYAEGGGVPSQHRAQFEKTLADLKIRTELNKKYNDLYEKKRVENQPTIQEFYAMHGIQHKAEGGAVQPSLNHMRMALMTGGKIPYTDISNIGADEAPSMGVKAFINPNERNNMGPGGVQLPTGGIDMNPQQPGQQLMPQQPQQQPQGQPSPLSAGASSPLQQPPSNILQMTPQGQAMNAMTPPKQMAEGGEVEHMANGGYMTPEDHYHQLLMRHYMGDKLSKADNIALGLYHRVGGGKKLNKPIGEYQFNVAPNLNVNMAPEKIITPEDLFGGHGMPFIGDSSMAGRIITGAEGHQFDQPVEVEGGHDYMRANALHKDKSKRAIWASAPGKIKHLTQKAERLKTKGPVYGIHTGMSPTGVDFSHMPAEVLGEMVKKSKITKKSEKEFNKEMSARFKDFPGLMHEDLHEMLRAPGSGELRKHFVKRMATDKYQNAGFPEIAMARLAVQHPNLMQHDEPGKEYVGSSIGRFNPNYSLVDNPVNPHHSYPAVIGGEYVGALHSEKDKPLLTTKDFFHEFHKLRREFNAPEGGDRRAFELAQPVQKFDQEWLDKVMPIYLARRKQLTGKKKGGSARLSTNKDMMQLELMRKPKKAK